MKKIIIRIIIVLIVAAIAIVLISNFSTKPNPEVENSSSSASNAESEKVENATSNTSTTESKEEPKEGYEINVSEKEIIIEKGAEASFDITFTNPDETSIREYIHCEDQDDIIVVKYTPLEDSKITVEIKALKEGTTEIVVCDYNYPDVKEIVKVNVEEVN